ncbi:MAG: dUTP diphosphatase [Myxococcota bacterium]
MSRGTIGVILREPGARMPEKAHEHDAGWDIFATQEGFVCEGCIETFSTGLQFDVPPGWEVQIRSRSGLARKHGIALANGVGTIDSNYSGIVAVMLTKLGAGDRDDPEESAYQIAAGDKIAQAVIYPVFGSMELRDHPHFTGERGETGFGDSGR